tara:strand:+ start:781 stop:1560 length:780 start_codon:yes stop_codon:yes gene_type:complete
MSAVAAAVIGGVATLGGGLIAAGGAKKAANVQAEAAREAQAANERALERQIGLQEPFRQAGLTAQQQIMQLLGIGGDASAEGYGSLAKPFGQTDFEQDPGYAFRQAEGMRALERSASARGNLLSGGTLRGIQRFGQDLASQEYGNAFNRYQIERSARLNPLQSLMGSGQSATNVMTGATGQAGQNEAANLYGAGQARASGYVGQANALGGALSSIGQAAASYPLMQAQMNYFNSLGRGGAGGSGGMTPIPAGAYRGIGG